MQHTEWIVVNRTVKKIQLIRIAEFRFGGGSFLLRIGVLSSRGLIWQWVVDHQRGLHDKKERWKQSENGPKKLAISAEFSPKIVRIKSENCSLVRVLSETYPKVIRKISETNSAFRKLSEICSEHIRK